MSFQGEKRYTFVSSAKAADTFAVVRFSGHEAISQPYRFEIELATDDAEIDLHTMLQAPARFVIHRKDAADRVFNGVPAEFVQMQEAGAYVIYKAVLVPRLWNAGLYHENQLFLEKSVQDIIKEVLEQTRLTGEDYTFRLTNAYQPWEYLCQWRETDLNFIHRWMEREGIYYYFTQDGQKEKMIITDSAASHENICAECRIPYSPPSAMVPRNKEVIQSIVCRQRKLPRKVILRDYNYRRPSLELKAEATVDAKGHGEVYFYGEHFKTPEEGSRLAKIRAQELLCKECVYSGESTAANVCAGYLFTLQDHYRQSYNQQYLVIEVEHQGHQAIAGLSGQQRELSAGEKQTEYTNRFTAIPAGAQFRPENSATKPKFYGTLNATVDVSGNGEYAEIDEQGRYKVILPFDRSGNNGGRASRWIRMAQPYAGNSYGMHFPLHKGTEVLLTFIDGDPDRPIIAGSVPNPETASPITSANLTKSMVRSASGNEYHLDDQKGSENIYTRAVKDQTTDVANNRTKTVGGNEKNKISGNKAVNVGANQKERIGADKSISVGANHNETIAAGMNLSVGAARKVNIAAAENKSVGGSSSTQVGGTQSVSVGGAASESVGKAKTLNVGAAYLVNVAGVMNTIAGVSSSEEVGFTKIIYAGDSIIIKSSGSIKIDGASVEIVGKSGVKISGAVVDIN